MTLAAGILSLTRRFDEAEGLVLRSLALDPDQPEALRRLGFIQNFRGDGRRAAAAFRRALRAYPTGNDGSMSLIGLGVANFICGDYGRSARALSRALEQQPSRAWPHRFLTAAAMHAGAHDEARRSLTSLQTSLSGFDGELVRAVGRVARGRAGPRAGRIGSRGTAPLRRSLSCATCLRPSWLPALRRQCPSSTRQGCPIRRGWGEVRKRYDHQPHAKRPRRASVQSQIETNRVSPVERLRYAAAASVECMELQAAHRPESGTGTIGTAPAQKRPSKQSD